MPRGAEKKKRGKVTVQHHNFASSSSEGGGKRQKKGKLKYSNYYFTINTNQTKKAISKRKFIKSIASTFDNIENIIQFKKGSIDDVESIKVSTHPEIGKAKGLVHAHALVKIKHRAMVSIPYDAMRQTLLDNGVVKPDSGFHFYSKLVRDNVGNVRDYMKKTFNQ